MFSLRATYGVHITLAFNCTIKVSHYAVVFYASVDFVDISKVRVCVQKNKYELGSVEH